MKMRPEKVSYALDALAQKQLNAAERLRVAERLIEDVQEQLSPLHDPVMCVAEGMLRAVEPGLEQAREHVESWQQEDLPVAT